MTTNVLPPKEDKPRGCYNCDKTESACECPEDGTPDLDVWRREAGEAIATSARLPRTTRDILDYAEAARTGWLRDAARVGVLCAEVERLRAALAVAERAASLCASEVATLRAECARLGVEAADAKWSLMP